MSDEFEVGIEEEAEEPKVVQFPKVRGQAPKVLGGTPAKSRRAPGPYDEIPDELLTPAQEAEIRKFFGYSLSETRTRAERQAVADRIVAQRSP